MEPLEVGINGSCSGMGGLGAALARAVARVSWVVCAFPGVRHQRRSLGRLLQLDTAMAL